MQLWPVLLWPKPKARRHTQHDANRNINAHSAASTTPTGVRGARPASKRTLFYAFVITVLPLITSTRGLTVAQHPTASYEGLDPAAEGAALSALTGLSNGYASANYMKNYYAISDSEDLQRQQEKNRNNAVLVAVNSGPQDEMGAGAITGRGFAELQSNIYGNGVGLSGGGGAEVSVQAHGLSVYDGGFVPTTFTAAGQHYAASLAGLQSATDKSKTLHQYARPATNQNNLHANYQPYVNVNSNYDNNSNNNNIVSDANSNKAQHSLYKRLSNYAAGLNNGDRRGAGDGDGDADVDTTVPNFEPTDDGETVAGTATAEAIQNYGLAYADDAQQPSLLQNYYNPQTPFIDALSLQEQAFANYFPPSMAASAGYEIENQQKYYTLNNYQPTTEPPLLEQPFEQKPYAKYQNEEQQARELRHPFNKLETPTPTAAPETYYQTYIQHKNGNKEHQHQYRHVADDNYRKWKQNQIMANYLTEQSAVQKQQYREQQQQQQQLQQEHKKQQHQQQQQEQQQRQKLQQNNYYQQQPLVQEPETAETSQTSHFKKLPKHKSKRHDSHDKHDEHNYNYDILLEQNENTIDQGSNDYSNAVQLQQLERLQEQMQHQQQQFIELQHQLIDHDQQLQIQKHIASVPIPTLPPITQTVHHSPHSLQALAGSPLSKHTHIVKTIPVPQHQKVHVPYRENVTVEVPDAIIAPIKKPFAIQIPVTRTVTVPKIQEVKIPIEKVKPFPVERPIPYIVERRVPYKVEKQIAQPVYYPVPIKVPILHTVIHKVYKPQGPQHRPQPSYHLPHTVYRKRHSHSLK